MYKVILILFFSISLSYAAVPTVNATDAGFKIKYSGQVMSYLTYLSQIANQADNIQKMTGLSKAQSMGATLCNLCKPQDMADLQVVLSGINGDLCTAFGAAMDKLSGVQKQYQDLSAIQAALQSNPAEAQVALQQAVLQTQYRQEQILRDMQTVQLQQVQKQMIEEKMQNQYRTDFFTGIKGQ